MPPFPVTSIALNNQAVLIAGPSGVGKTDVAVRLIESGAALISDDQTNLRLSGKLILAAPPPTIAGMIELRHIGLYTMPFVQDIPVALYVELHFASDQLERLPEPSFVSLLDQKIRRIHLVGTEASTPAKIRIALLGTAI